MENLIKGMIMENVLKLRLSTDNVIELLNKGEAILLDIRYSFETENGE
jgi:hypothetical protein